MVDKQPLKGSYRKAASERRVLRRIRRLGAPRGTDTAEGFMFPATYTLVDGSPARDLVTKQLAAFEDNFKGIDMRYAKRKNLTRYDVLIIASMIEREVQIDRERPLVAAVIYNRLAWAMPLGIDATIRYEKRNWDRPLRVSRARGRHALQHAQGAAACRRRRSATRAASRSRRPPTRRARTTSSTCVKPCGEGAHAFSSTDAQFAARRRGLRRQARGARRQVARRLLTTYLGVCGWPVAHSRSPQMQNAALAAVGLDGWRYLRLPLPPELFEETVRALPAAGFRGVNVTIPHKQAALALADETTVAAQAIGAANTLTFEDGAHQRRQHRRPGADRGARRARGPAGRALVLGAGGAARAAVWALATAGAPRWRSGTARRSGPRALARELGVRAVEASERPTSSSTARPSGSRSGDDHVQGPPAPGR